MRRTLIACFVLALLAALPASFVATSQVAEAGPSREFKEYGFKWALPDDWAFGSTSAQDKKYGIVAVAECSMASVKVWVYTAPTEGLGLDERVKDVKAQGSGGMGDVNRTAVGDTTLSGIKGKVVAMKIDADGNEGHFRTYIIESGGKFYQMIVQAWHGAHSDEREAINGVRKGFRLLDGAGGTDKDEAFDEFGSGDDSGDDEGGDDSGSNGGGNNGGGSANDDWPRGGAEKVGNTVKLPTHNLEWTLPADSPFRWTDAPTKETEREGRFVVARAKVERKAKQEYEKDRPASTVMLDLIIQDIPPGLKVNTWVKGGMATDNVKNWKFFDDISSGKTRTFESKKVGNLKGGAIIKLEGKKDGRSTMLLMFTATLRDKWYIFRAYAQGASDIYKHMRKDIAEAVKGVKYLDTSELMRGPLIGAIPDFAWHRGKDKDKEKTYKGPGYTFKKPKGMQYVQVRDSMNRDIRFTGEMRNEEGDAYLYFEIRSYRLNIPNTPNPKPEKFVSKRGEDWSAGAGESANVGKKKGELGKKGTFRGAKGLKYEFTGDLNGVPYLEKGYVVKHKANMLWFKFQFGGKDAEKKLKKMAKAVEKGVKFNK